MIVKVEQPSCMTCRFFDYLPARHEGRFGRCLRNPPQFIESGVLNGGWPVVEKDEWCGEHAEYQDDQG